MGIIENVKKSITGFFNRKTPAGKTYREAGKEFLFGPKNITKNIVPFSASRAAAVTGAQKAGSILSKGWNFAKTFTTKKTINPAAGASGASNIFKILGKAVGTGALVGTIFQTGRMVSKAGVSGKLPEISDAASSLARGATTGAGLGLSPAGGIIGALEGTGKNVSNIASNFYNILRGKGQSMVSDAANKFQGIKENLPSSPNINYNFNIPEGFNQNLVPQVPSTIYVESPVVPSYSAPTYAPSFSLGSVGGMGENLPLILLAMMGLGGYAGYKLGKRKKKKYKKRKRH